MFRFNTTAIAVAAAVAMTGFAAEARELRAASGAPPAHPSQSHMYAMLPEVLAEESGGALTATLLGTEVVTLPQMKDALQSGLVEVGNLLPLYFPADLPNMSLAGEMALSGRKPQVMAAAMTEYMVTCDTCQAELSKFGIVYLGSGSSDVYVLLTNKPVHNKADLAGMRLRSGGAPFSRWAEHFGAVPANIAVGDTFESMSQGVIDGSIASVADLLSFRLVELAKAVTVMPLGTYHATSDFSVSTAAWSGMSGEERAALTRAANRLNAVFTDRWSNQMPEEARAAATEAGIEFIEPDADFLAESNAFTEADAATAAQVATDTLGIADAADRVARFQELVVKWDGLLAGIETDPDAIATKVQAEIWDKVDLASYGQP